jgi:two-component system phosphate regulon sensor histidine kinase PhoR
MLYNLINNAIKYVPEGRKPEILIKSCQENEYNVISIADNGVGISKENQDLIFEKFQRVTSAYEGSGVGLYLVNTIVSTAGGKITIDSEVGTGSVFKIYLRKVPAI